MEMNSGILIAVAAVVVVGFLLARHGRRSESALLTPSIPPPTPPTRFARPQDRETQKLIDWLLARAHEETGVRVADDPLAVQRVTEAAQKAVQEMRTGDSATVSLPFLTADASGPKHFEARVTRDLIRDSLS